MESWRKRWLSNISHDLKTPITLVKGYLEALFDGTIKPEQSGRYMRKANDRLDSVNRLVKDLNDLSLLEMKQIKPRLEYWEAAALLEELIQDWEEEIRAAGRDSAS